MKLLLYFNDPIWISKSFINIFQLNSRKENIESTIILGLALVCTPGLILDKIWSRGCKLWCFHGHGTNISSATQSFPAWFLGKPVSGTVWGPVSTHVLEPIMVTVSRLLGLFCSKQDLAGVPSVWFRPCPSSTKIVPRPVSGTCSWSCSGTCFCSCFWTVSAPVLQDSEICFWEYYPCSIPNRVQQLFPMFVCHLAILP